MSIQSVYKKNIITIAPNSSILAAAQAMKREQVGSLVVTIGVNGSKKPIGILTDRDIVRLVVASEVDAGRIAVENIMTREVKVVRESEDLHEAMRLMRLYGVRRMPVVAEDGSLLGIVSLDDFLGLLANELHQLAKTSVVERKNEAERTISMQ